MALFVDDVCNILFAWFTGFKLVARIPGARGAVVSFCNDPGKDVSCNANVSQLVLGIVAKEKIDRCCGREGPGLLQFCNAHVVLHCESQSEVPEVPEVPAGPFPAFRYADACKGKEETWSLTKFNTHGEAPV